MTTILGTYGNTRLLAVWEYMGILGSKGLRLDDFLLLSNATIGFIFLFNIPGMCYI